MSLRIDVHEVEEATKIRAKYLRALENEEFDLLPGNAYVKSFLRTYADYLELDSRALVDQFRSQGYVAEEEAMTYSPATDVGSPRRRIWLLVAMLLAVVVITLLLVGALSGGGGGG